MQATEFWDKIFAQGQGGSYSRIEMPDLDDPILQAALRFFGSVENKTLIDLGCGRGATSLFFARCGANVISVDASAKAIENLSDYCKANAIANITALHLPAQAIGNLPKVDHVFGAMILHHIEPFAEFAQTLRAAVRPGGTCFFWENSARSKAMIWFRQHLVGKLWIPKHGDPDEFPLMPSEVDELRRHFTVRVAYPELDYFRKVSTYLLRGRLMGPLLALDRYCYRFERLRKHSYQQCLYLS